MSCTPSLKMVEQLGMFNDTRQLLYLNEPFIIILKHFAQNHSKIKNDGAIKKQYLFPNVY